MNTTQTNPYIGPRTFRKDEGHLFFGREREARDLIALVASEKLVLFYAQSGAGKSSLVNTRLIPSLEFKSYQVLPVGRVGGDGPGNVDVDNIFVYNLIRGIVQQKADDDVLANLSLPKFLAGLDVDENGYFYNVDLLEELDEPIKDEGTAVIRRALILDQFEELLSTHSEAWEKRDDFFEQLAQAMQEDPYLWVILVMREDYIANLDPYAHFLPGELRVRYYMQRLERDAALQAIKIPAMNRQRPYADGVAESLVDDLSRSQIVRPDGDLDYFRGQYVEPIVLQAVCYRLWEKLPEGGSEITKDDLLRFMVDVNKALGGYYAERVKDVVEGEVAQKLEIKEREIREWFGKELITEGGTRNKVAQGIGGKSGRMDDAIAQEFVKRGDLVRAEKSGSGLTFYELTHDRMVEPILTNNKEWDISNSSYFRPQAEAWDEGGRSEIELLSGEALSTAQQYARENPNKLIPLEEEFLEDSQISQNEKQAKLRTRILISLATIGIVLFGAVVWVITANRERQIALDASKAALEAKTEAINAEQQAQASADKLLASELAEIALDRSVRIDHSILLSIAAYNKSRDDQKAQQALFDNLQRVQRNYQLASLPDDSATDIFLSSNGSSIAALGEEWIIVWPLSDQPGQWEKIDVEDTEREVYFSPDGRIFTTVDRMGIRRWSLNETSVDELGGSSINFHDGAITDLFTRGSMFFSIGEDGSYIRWNETDDSQKQVWIRGSDETIVISPSGNSFAVIDGDDIITLRDMENPENSEGEEGKYPIFSPDGTYFAFVGIDKTITIRTVLDDNAKVTIWPELEGNISALNFSEKGEYLTASDGSQTEIWEFRENGEWVSFETLDMNTAGHFSPDGKMLAFSNRIYCLSSKQLLNMPSGQVFYTFSPNGKTLVTWSAQGSGPFLLWNIEDGCDGLADIDPSEISGVTTILLSPNGETLVGIESDGTIRIRDAGDGAVFGDPLYQPDGDEFVSLGPLFSPGGNRLALLDGENEIHLWNISRDSAGRLVAQGFDEETPEEILSASITDFEFVTDDVLVAGRKDGYIVKWNIASENISPLLDADVSGRIVNLVFNPAPGTNQALSISQNSTVLIDVMNGEQLSEPMEGEYQDVHWGKGLLATLLDGSIAIWDIETGTRFEYDDSISGTMVHFIPSGGYFLVSDGEEMALYDTENFELIGNPVKQDLQDYEIVFPKDQKNPNRGSFALTENNKKVYVYTFDVNIDDAEENTDVIKMEGVSRYPYGNLLIFAPDGDSLYFKEKDNYLDVLDWSTDIFSAIDKGLGGPASAGIYMDERTLILGETTSLDSVHLYDIENVDTQNPEFIETIDLSFGQTINVLSTTINQDGTLLAVLSDDGVIYWWDISRDFEPQVAGGVFGNSKNPVTSAVVNQSGDLQAFFSRGGIELSDIVFSKNGGEGSFSELVNKHIMQVKSASFGLGGRVLAVEGDGEQYVFYDLNDRVEIKRTVPANGIFVVTDNKPEINWVTQLDDTKTIWNSARGVKMKEISEKEKFIASSPDGNFVVVKNDQDGITLWGVDGGQVVFETADDKPLEVDSVSGEFKSFSPNSLYFVIQSSGGFVSTIWEIEVNSVESEDSSSRAVQIASIDGTFVKFSNNGLYAVFNDSENTLLLWDVKRHGQFEELDGEFVAFDPYSRFLAYRRDNQFFVWDTTIWGRVGPIISGDSVRFSSDGLILIAETSKTDPSFSLFDLQTGRKIDTVDGEIIFDGVDESPYVYYDNSVNEYFLYGVIDADPIPGEDVEALKASANGRLLVTVTTSVFSVKTGQFWDRLRGGKIGDEFNLEGKVLGFSPDGKTLIIQERNDSYILVDTTDPANTRVFKAEKVIFSEGFEFALAINAKDEDGIILWDIGNRADYNISKSFDINTSLYDNADFSPGRKILALYGRGGVLLWDIAGEKPIEDKPLQENSGMVKKMVFSPDNQYLASLGSDGIIISRIETKPSLTLEMEVYRQMEIIKDMSFNSASSITLLHDDFGVSLVDINSGDDRELRAPIHNPKAICAYTLSPNGMALAYQIADKIFVWNLMEDPPTEPVQIDEGIKSSCSGGGSVILAFNSNGSRLAIGDGDQIHVKGFSFLVRDTLIRGKDFFSHVSRIVFVDEKTIAVEDLVDDEHMIGLWDVNRSEPKITVTGDLENLISNGSLLFYRDDLDRVVLLDVLSPERYVRFDQMKELLCAYVGIDEYLTKDEWEKYLPNEAYPDNPGNATCLNWPLKSEPEPQVTSTH